MARRMLVAGNWKMNGRMADADAVAAIAEAAGAHPGVEVALYVPATLITRFAEGVAGGAVLIGGQDCHVEAKGAFTGSIAAGQLADAGARGVIVGHSERRQGCHESDAMVAAKAAAGLAAGLDVILCVGEPLAVREAGRAEAEVTAQLLASLPDGAGETGRLTIAYEPIWAIGTGRTASPEDAQAMHGALRAALAGRLGADRAAAMRILYGGSVTGANAAALFGQGDIDGALVGGASLTAEGFAPIIAAAAGAGAGAA